MYHLKKWGWIGLGICFNACQSYQPIALEPTRLEQEQTRNSFQLESLNFKDALLRLDAVHPDLKKIHANLNKWEEIAKVKTPWANPSLQLGPAFGQHLGSTAASATQPFVGISFTIPLGTWRKKLDKVHQWEKAYRVAQSYHERQKLILRLKNALQTRFHLHQQQKHIHTVIAELNLKLKQLDETKQVGFLQSHVLSSFEFGLQKWKMEEYDLSILLAHNTAELSELLVCRPQDILSLRIEAIPSSPLPSLGEAVEWAQSNYSELTLAEIKFHISDAKLKLAIAKQVPDLQVGFDAEQEVGEKSKTLSLPFAIELPIFDRQHKNISMAFGEREQHLQAYLSQLNQTQTKLYQQLTSLNVMQEQEQYLRQHMLPSLSQLWDSTVQAFQIGSADISDLIAIFENINDHQKQALKLKALMSEARERFTFYAGASLETTTFTAGEQK